MLSLLEHFKHIFKQNMVADFAKWANEIWFNLLNKLFYSLFGKDTKFLIVLHNGQKLLTVL